MSAQDPQATARGALDAALAAADPEPAVRRWLRDHPGVARPQGRLLVASVGKAAAAMARGAWAERPAAQCWVVTKDGHGGGAPPGCHLRETGHPTPDGRSLAAGAELRGAVAELVEDDELLLLVSGGASALVEDLMPGLEPGDWFTANEALLASGRPIRELNAVRKHLSRLKGGGLARSAAPAQVQALLLSDVVGDEPAVIGSGPAAPDPTTFGDALTIAQAVPGIPEPVWGHLEAGARGRLAETPKPGELENARNTVVAGNRDALEAAARELFRQGYSPLVLTSRLQGEATGVAPALAAVAQEVADSGHPQAPPAALLWGGETTVTLAGAAGQGGRSQELALALAASLEGWPQIGVLCAGTDGTDGPGQAAGGWADGDTARRARAADYPVARALADHDSGGLLERLGDGVVTGPTGTNVMDLVIMLVEGGGG